MYLPVSLETRCTLNVLTKVYQGLGQNEKVLETRVFQSCSTRQHRSHTSPGAVYLSCTTTTSCEL